MSFSNNVVRVLIKLVRVVAEQQLTNVLFANVAEYNLLLLSSYLYIAEVAWTNKGGNSLCHNLAVYKKWYLIFSLNMGLDNVWKRFSDWVK